MFGDDYLVLTIGGQRAELLANSQLTSLIKCHARKQCWLRYTRPVIQDLEFPERKITPVLLCQKRILYLFVYGISILSEAYGYQRVELAANSQLTTTAMKNVTEENNAGSHIHVMCLCMECQSSAKRTETNVLSYQRAAN